MIATVSTGKHGIIEFLFIHPRSYDIHADVEHLTGSFRVRVVTANDFVLAAETSRWHFILLIVRRFPLPVRHAYAR